MISTGLATALLIVAVDIAVARWAAVVSAAAKSNLREAEQQLRAARVIMRAVVFLQVPTSLYNSFQASEGWGCGTSAAIAVLISAGMGGGMCSVRRDLFYLVLPQNFGKCCKQLFPQISVISSNYRQYLYSNYSLLLISCERVINTLEEMKGR